MKDILEKVDILIDLTINDPDFVAHNIPKAFIILQKEYDKIASRMILLRSKLEMAEKKHLDYLKHKADFSLSNKDEYNTFMAGNETINEINKRVRICERDLKTVENRIKIVMNLNFTIKNIIDYKLFKRGDS